MVTQTSRGEIDSSNKNDSKKLNKKRRKVRPSSSRLNHLNPKILNLVNERNS